MTTPTESNVPSKPVPAVAKPAAEPVNLHRLIRCLEEVEGGQWNHIGGKLCISRALWHDHGGRFNYRQASDPTVSREVSARALTSYIGDLVEHKQEASVVNLALYWRHGPTGAQAHLGKPSDYAQRVNNLYCDKTWEPSAND